MNPTQRQFPLNRRASSKQVPISNTMLPDISREFLTRMMEGKEIERVSVGVTEGGFDYAF